MKNIVLIGYMGCGKTTIATYLAKHESFQMIDTDVYIEEKEHKKVKDIFADCGEIYFRTKETDSIKALIQQYEKTENIVFSTGGGLPIKEENRALLHQLGTVVFLKVNAQTVYERLKGDTTRPLLQCENPMERIEQMLSERNPIYENAADFSIEVNGRTESAIVKDIIKHND